IIDVFFSSRPKDCVRSTAKKTGLFEKLSDPEKAYRHVQKWGFLSFRPGPADGISLTRTLASGIFPLPEERILAQDTPLVSAACLLGTVYGTSQVLASYIRHGMNLSMTQAWSDSQSRRDQILGNFLNDILQKMNKDRIISYYDSRYARHYYRCSGSTKELLKLAYKIPVRFFCLGTILFSIETLWHCLIGVLGIKKKTPAQNKKTSQQSKGKAGKVEPACMVHSDAWRGYSGLVGLGYKKYYYILLYPLWQCPSLPMVSGILTASNLSGLIQNA